MVKLKSYVNQALPDGSIGHIDDKTWENIVLFVKFIAPFAEVTKIVEKDKATGIDVWNQMIKLLKHIDSFEDDDIIGLIIDDVREGFLARCENFFSNEVIACAAVLSGLFTIMYTTILFHFGFYCFYFGWK